MQPLYDSYEAKMPRTHREPVPVVHAWGRLARNDSNVHWRPAFTRSQLDAVAPPTECDVWYLPKTQMPPELTQRPLEQRLQLAQPIK